MIDRIRAATHIPRERVERRRTRCQPCVGYKKRAAEKRWYMLDAFIFDRRMA